MTDIITASQVSREYVTGAGSVFALRDVSAAVEEATLTIFKGRSGSGKTTLLNIVGALDRPTAGSVIFQGKDIAKMSERKRDAFRRKHIGFVFQSVALIGQMTAYENIEFSLRIAGMSAGERRKRVIESLERVGLGKRMHHRPSELSGGEQQRVAIARAIAHRPVLVLADEPTAELDTKMGLKVVQLFRELIQIEGVTVLMSTHDPNMMELGDRVYTLEDGMVIDIRNISASERGDGGSAANGKAAGSAEAGAAKTKASVDTVPPESPEEIEASGAGAVESEASVDSVPPESPDGIEASGAEAAESEASVEIVPPESPEGKEASGAGVAESVASVKSAPPESSAKIETNGDSALKPAVGLPTHRSMTAAETVAALKAAIAAQTAKGDAPANPSDTATPSAAETPAKHATPATPILPGAPDEHGKHAAPIPPPEVTP